MAATDPSYYQSGVCQSITQKQHLFHLYMNQIAEGTPNANQKVIVNPGLPIDFGVTVANDWTISDGPAANANPIARARGMHMGDGKADVNWLFCHNILFTDTRFKGSSLKVLGDFVANKDSEWAIVGGTGEFAYAQGVVVAKVIQNIQPTPGRTWELRISAFCLCIPNMIKLAPSEFMKQVLGTTDAVAGVTVVTSLTLVSSVMTYGPFGKANGTPFCSQVPDSNTIAGFYARAGGSVNALGVYACPI
ncbi:unnamed protein product [Triticum turgidum subsp. durum]|uniref:Dirigent protein n=1 Tax=Triticum turgidum subsp. durum TaxID=4567 RepID=A0A9R0R4V6_TRITD|nr:unnamed protein product [Triticum turgidum subsp. durum]